VPAAAAWALYVAVARALRVVEPPDAIAVVAQDVLLLATRALYVACARRCVLLSRRTCLFSAVQVQRVVEPPDAIAVVAQDVACCCDAGAVFAAAQGVLPRLTVWRKPRSAGGRPFALANELLSAWAAFMCCVWKLVGAGSAARVLPHAPGGPAACRIPPGPRAICDVPVVGDGYFFPPPSGHCRCMK